ncbi:deoxyribonuclease HsdR [Hymenobacter lapidarius]|uniref:Deoxyribonuclease HsdR n=1 Tax=Hymenobacter lapidarius TaxID=1908237 RepID=A0A1G1T5Y4_9BACT|nr:Do family serine endopeptidase [Hymenobacter lapidarius]OGX86290.1 deoxyribonuclease HsdR [Hymenobacter lapidarius]
MQAKQMMLGLLGSAILGGGVAVGGYKLLEPAPVAPQAVSADPQVRYTSEMRSSAYAVPEGLNFVAAAAAVTPAVVHVMTEYAAPAVDRRQQQMDPFLRQFFGDQLEQFQGQMPPGHPQVPRGGGQGSGSGVIIAANGYIVTNNHVIDKASKIEVVLDDKRKFEAELVGADPNTDLAVLKVKADNLPFVKYGNSDDVRVGQWVLAVGNPFNLNSTVTAGIISAKGRNIDILRRKDNMGIESFIQTDAVVNPGNSGGALVNLNGDLIGINSAIASHTGSFEGYAFAIPSSLASKVVDDLLKYKVVQRALLGVQIQEVDARLASEKKLATLNGVYVQGFSESSAAAAAGLKAGDIITKINGASVNTSSQLQEQVARFRPGDKIKVNFLRGTAANEVTAVLRNATGTTSVVREEPASATVKYEGATLSPVPAREQNKLGLEGGAQISGIKGSNFRETGIADGFIITRIDKNQVNNPADVKKYLDEAREKSGALVEGVYPDGRKAYYPIGQE